MIIVEFMPCIIWHSGVTTQLHIDAFGSGYYILSVRCATIVGGSIEAAASSIK